MTRHLLLLLFLLTVCCAAPTLAENKPIATPEIGDTAPDWKDLAGTDGKQHSLSALKGVEVVVVCFTCNSCPYSVDYEDRLIAFQN